MVKWARILFTVALLWCATLVDAGCKKRKVELRPEERFHNHQPLLSTLDLDSLPKAFSWQDVDGKSMLVSSWNQHIVS
jgi:hypothetical protein